MPNLFIRRAPAVVAGVLALALGTTALTAIPGLAESGATPPAVALPRQAGPDFADVAARVAPSVVRIVAVERGKPALAAAEVPPDLRGTPFGEMFRRFGGDAPQQRQPRRAGQGSGFVIGADGHIVTNAHVVGEAGTVQVILADGREMEARVVGTDPLTDIALIKVEAGAPLPAVALGDSDAARVGQWVMAMGNPFGLGGTASSRRAGGRSAPAPMTTSSRPMRRSTRAIRAARSSTPPARWWA